MDNNWIIDNLTYAFGVLEPTTDGDVVAADPIAAGVQGRHHLADDPDRQRRRCRASVTACWCCFWPSASSAAAPAFGTFQRPEHVLRHFIYFVMAKLAVTYGIDLMVDIFAVCAGIISAAAGSVGGIDGATVSLPAEMAAAIGGCGILASIPTVAGDAAGESVITVLAFLMILTVYGRFFKLYLYAALSPVALASFAGEETSQMARRAFLKSYMGVCLEGAVIVLACIVFSAFAASDTVVLGGGSVVTQVWGYLGEVIFNMLVLVGLVKGADRVVREMFGM